MGEDSPHTTVVGVTAFYVALVFLLASVRCDTAQTMAGFASSSEVTSSEVKWSQVKSSEVRSGKVRSTTSLFH